MSLRAASCGREVKQSRTTKVTRVPHSAPAGMSNTRKTCDTHQTNDFRRDRTVIASCVDHSKTHEQARPLRADKRMEKMFPHI